MVYPRGRLTLTYCSGHIWHVLIFDSSKNILNLFFFLAFPQSPSNFTKMKRIKDCILLSRCYRFLYIQAVLDWISSFASFDMDFKSTSLKSNKGKWWFYGFVCIFCETVVAEVMGNLDIRSVCVPSVFVQVFAENGLCGVMWYPERDSNTAQEWSFMVYMRNRGHTEVNRWLNTDTTSVTASTSTANVVK